jgi:hypothetical protein
MDDWSLLEPLKLNDFFMFINIPWNRLVIWLIIN